MQASAPERLVGHYVTLEGVANAVATNKDSSQCVVAGRNVFKIYNIEPDRFIEKLNLRVGKNLDLSYSCADIVWNPVDNSVLATAATNGWIVTWNLNAVHNKQDLKFHDHKRTVNKVCFHTTEAHLLLSGSQDGTMRLFDLRKKECTSTFYSLSESVRDVQFCPNQYFSFAAVQENGYVQLWDLRRTDRFERQFAAHNGPVFTCDWHPDDERVLLATAGRDKTIKVWDMSYKETLEYYIQTVSSVNKIKWRPNKKHHIASTSLVVDFTVNVWDVRRPFVPYAVFMEHKDSANGIGCYNDPSLDITAFAWCTHKQLLTTRKDCTLFYHNFAYTERPDKRSNPYGLEIDPMGDVGFAFNKNILKDNSASLSNKSQSTFSAAKFLGKKTSTAKEYYKSYNSDLVVLEDKDELLSMKWFVETAKRYMLHGKPLQDLCEHNANVAMDLDRVDVSQTWQMLKLLYTSGSVLLNEYAQASSQDSKNDKDYYTVLESSQDGSQKHSKSSKPVSRHVSGGSHATDRPHSGDNFEDDSDSGNTEHENTLTYIASELTQGDFYFGDGEAEVFRMLDYAQIAIPADEDWTLPREAFNIRHRLGDGSPPPEIANMPSSPLCAAEEISDRQHNSENEEEHNMMLAMFNPPRFPAWNFTELVVEMLEYYAEQGDVQMCVSVLIVLGDKFKGTIKEGLMEQWFHSYIDLLGRYQLWNVSNEVIALSSLPAINCLNQQSTMVHSICSKCSKLKSKAGWFCDGCKEVTICSLCHMPVRGAYAWCQGCTHGGHLNHLQEWFKENKECPTGCGHLCEYV